jgi:acyl carrier protein
MSENATKVDLTNVDDVEEMVREIARMICAEQPDMPEPESLRDLDSFSVVQVLLEVENTTDRKLLEKFEDFTEGEEFRDLAAYIVKIVAEEDAAPAETPAAATTPPAAPPAPAAPAPAPAAETAAPDAAAPDASA